MEGALGEVYDLTSLKTMLQFCLVHVRLSEAYFATAPSQQS